MKKNLIKLTILALASGFAIAPIANAQDEEGADTNKRPERPARPEGGRPGGPGGFDREAFMKEFDKNKDGKLDDEERKASRAAMEERSKKAAEERFKTQDADNNGVISLEEFKKGNDRLGDRAEEIFTKLNTDGKEGLTKEELAAGRQARGPRGGAPGTRPEGAPRGPRGAGDAGGADQKGAGRKRPAADEGKN